MKTCVCLLLAASSVSAAPAICTALSSVTTLSDWTGGGAAAHWSCSPAASGGAGLTIQGNTVTLPAGVPGAAGAGDAIVVPTGITVHVPATVGIELISSGTTLADGVTINATNNGTYGALVIDKGGLLEMHANGSIYHYATVARYGVMQVAPGGYLRFGHTGGNPTLSLSGRLYLGCDDQAVNASPFCADSADTPVTASVAATLNFTAVTSLSTLLGVGDLVTVTNPPMSCDVWPYTTGCTSAARIPVMPTTSDTGTSPMKTCGSAATCTLPDGYLYCVVQISGSSVSLGWPHGGTATEPVCDGGETALVVTAAGSGTLHLKKVAFVQGDPADYVWNNSKSYSPSSEQGYFDPLMSALGVSFAPISNAAGTGSGRYGDTSLSVTSQNWGASCIALTISAVQSSGCLVDNDYGMIWANGPNKFFTGAMTYKTASTPTAINGAVVPQGAGSGNEMVIANAYFTYVVGGLASDGVFQFKSLNNSTGQHMAFRGNVVRMSSRTASVNGFVASSSSTPLQFTGNSYYADNSQDNSAFAIGLDGSTNQYIDISNNWSNSSHYFLGCQNGQDFTQFYTTSNLALTNNLLWNDAATIDNSVSCITKDALIQDNMFLGHGQGAVSGQPYQFGTRGLCGTDAAHPNLFKWNLYYGEYRAIGPCGNQAYTNQAVLYSQHHFIAFFNTDSATYGGYLPNISIKNSIMTNTVTVQGLDCVDIGYNQASFIDGVEFSNNTCYIVETTSSATGLLWGDADPNEFTAITGGKALNNLFFNTSSGGASNGYSKQVTVGVPYMTQVQMSDVGYSSVVAGTIPYQSTIDVHGNNIPNPQYYRNIRAVRSGVNYNTAVSRGVTGVAIQNPNYVAPVAAGALRFTYTSRSNMTMQWANDGVTFGTAVQLNWGGAGTTYTIASVVDPGLAHQYLTVNVTGTPFTAVNVRSAIAPPAGAPICRWVLMVTGANAGRAYQIMSVGGADGDPSGQLTITPHDTGFANGDTFAVISTEIRLADGNALGTVDIGIDARSLPTSTATDSGIALNFTDYASTVTTLPPAATQSFTDYTKLPQAGGNARDVFASGYYLPSGTTWRIGALDGGYLGAVAPTWIVPAISGKVVVSGKVVIQ